MPIKNVIISAVIIACVALAVAVIGAAVMVYWPYILVAVVAIIGGVVYFKRQKRLKNLV